MAKTVKEKLLEILIKNKGIYCSGQDLANTLGITRAAVWKAVSSLRKSGYDISALTNKGYSLSENCNYLSESEICSLLSEKASQFFVIETAKVLTSTNSVLKERAACENEGLVIIAEEQTAGRGRLGRSFYSPGSTGLYLSVLLKPRLPAEKAVSITAMAAVAAANAVENLDGFNKGDIKIKWVNDLYKNDKKVCGILTEAMLSFENGGLDYAVLGLGFNIYPPKDGWPEDISVIAGSLFETAPEKGIRNRLAANFLNEFLPLYENISHSDFLESYRSRQMLYGKTVEVFCGDTVRTAKVIAVDDNLRLVVKFTDNGEISALGSGEVHIKPIRKSN